MMKSWKYKDIEVSYHDHLDGAGTDLAVPMVEFIKSTYPGKTFGKIFEWCSGPAFIGFSLLQEGLCDKLCLADINPEAIACVEHTVKHNGLKEKATYYVSDNFDSVPDGELFDLVISNPPNYFAINPESKYYDEMKDDLRPNDAGWRIHKKFYSQVSRHMNPGGLLLISEVEPGLTEYYPDVGEPAYDVRPNPPINDFKKMIADGGLNYERTIPFLNWDNTLFCFVVSTAKQ